MAKAFPKGPQWAPSGPSVTEFLQHGSAVAPAAASAAPPPPAPAAPPKARAGPPPAAPPPPPPGSLSKPKAAEPAGKPTGMAALFADLNRGTAVTSGLRKVTDDMKTKNRAPEERSAVVPAAAAAPPAASRPAAKPAPAQAANPPRLELVQGQKWTVEHQVGVPDLVIAETEPKQTVYVYGCRDSTIQVRGKVNAISLDRCTKVGLLFESVVSSVELVNCASVAVQCTGTAPTLAIDACDGVQVGWEGVGIVQRFVWGPLALRIKPTWPWVCVR